MGMDIIARALAASKVGLVNGKIPSQYLPSYVDEIVDAYIIPDSTPFSSGWLSLTSDGTALTPDKSVVYNILTSGEYFHWTFRWSGTSYVTLNVSSTAEFVTEAQLQELLLEKQDKTDDTLETINKTIVGAINELNTSKYTKPTEGISLDDLSSSVQESLSKADTAIQHVKTINGQPLLGEGNIVIGDGGTSLPALPEDASTKTYILKAVNGVLMWTEEQLVLTEVN